MKLLVIQITALMAASLPLASFSQSIIKSLEVEYGAWNDGNEFLVESTDGNYIVGFEYLTRATGVIIGDTLIEAFRQDTIEDNVLGLTDYYLVKFDSEYNITGTFVVDNAEYIRDYALNQYYCLLSYTHYEEHNHPDSMYPLTLAGEHVIIRDGRRGQGVLIVLDSDLNYLKHLFVTSGQLGQVTIEGEYAYLEIRIPAGQEFITVASDTVYNYTYNVGSGDEVGFQTIALCKYNLITDTVVWLRRIGGPGDEVLWDLKLARNGDLLILGTTNSTRFHYSELDSAMNYEVDKPFLARYDSEGNFLWGHLNTDNPGDSFYNVESDHEGNIYVQGIYAAVQYQIGDTTIYNPIVEGRVPYRGIVVKYSSNGTFQWIAQLDGAFQSSNLFDLDFMPNDEIVVSGVFRDGLIRFGETEYIDSGPLYYAFLWILDSASGAYRKHLMTEGEGQRWFGSTIVDDSYNLNLYLLLIGKDTILNQEFASIDDRLSGFMVKMTSDFPSSLVKSFTNTDFVHVSPNPVAQGNSVTLSLSPEVTIENLECHLYNSTGTLVYSHAYPGVENTISFKIPPLASGQYWIAVNTMDKIDVSPLVIE